VNQKSKIAVVGSNMIDLISYLKRTPARGETVYGKEFQQGFGGKGSNQAVMASLLGAEISMVTAVGDDVYGDNWLEHYQEEGIQTDFVKVVKDTHSGVAAIWVEPEGDNRIVISPGANEDVSVEYVETSFNKMTQPDVVLSQLENPQASILAGFKKGKGMGATTILNPAPAESLLDEILRYTDWLVPNETELAFLAKEMYDLTSENPNKMIKEFAELSQTNLVVTIGDKGALLYMTEEEMKVERIPTSSVTVKDTTGAGDAFCGAFAYGISNDFKPKKAIALANVLASDSVQRNGTQVSYPRGEALEKLVEQVFSS